MEENNQIEFNSMLSILERLSRITYDINSARARRDIPAFTGHLVDYYKEISSDLTDKEMNIWENLKSITRLRPGGNKTEKWVFEQLNEMDIKLRRLAKKHGFLTKTSADKGKAMLG